jgi:hypothetical protein
LGDDNGDGLGLPAAVGEEDGDVVSSSNFVSAIPFANGVVTVTGVAAVFVLGVAIEAFSSVVLSAGTAIVLMLYKVVDLRFDGDGTEAVCSVDAVPPARMMAVPIVPTLSRDLAAKFYS